MERDIYYQLGGVWEDECLELYSSTTASYCIFEKENQLIFKGSHYGPQVEMMSGKDEYEFYYIVSAQGYNSLVEALQTRDATSSSLKEVFLKKFGVEDGSYRFLAFCEENGIAVEVHSL